ncbi:hypothetical protein ACET3Z_013858 [Daucus carota]
MDICILDRDISPACTAHFCVRALKNEEDTLSSVCSPIVDNHVDELWHVHEREVTDGRNESPRHRGAETICCCREQL